MGMIKICILSIVFSILPMLSREVEDDVAWHIKVAKYKRVLRKRGIEV